ncbi:MAG: hypothetical protein GY910_05765 [bacterium]|nr:hypothetical protein [bacterium]
MSIAVSLIVLGSLIGTAVAEPVGTGPTAEEVAELRRRIEELEGKQIDAEVQPAGANEIDPVLHRVAPSDWPFPPVTIGVLASVDYLFTDQLADGDGDSNHFSVGDLDLFLVSQPSDRFSILGELLLEFDSNNDTRTDAERLLIKYEYADWLSVAVGRGHTAIGYWNRTFHHGTFLWTTVSRPLIFEFEDEGGILPMHSVGIEASGIVETPKGLIAYTFMLSNGRGRNPDDIQLTDDVNDSKRVGFELSWRLSGLPDFAVGLNFMYDDIPGDPDPVAPRRKLDEYIGGGYVIYTGRPLEILVEGQYIRHHQPGSGYNSFGGYAQASYKMGEWTPYYRFDLLEIDGDDPFYMPVSEIVDTRQHSVGVRFDWTSFLTVKFEYQRVNSPGRNANVSAVQTALRF